MESQNTSSNKAIIGIIVVVLIAIAATAVIVVSSNNKSNSANVTTTNTSSNVPSTETSSSSSSVSSSSTFKDGTYSATSNYDTPGGGASIGVTVMLSGNTITNVSLTQGAPDREAQEFQDRFESGYKSLVVGKKITDVSLSRVAGSSLTPNGFNNALQDIESQAKA